MVKKEVRKYVVIEKLSKGGIETIGTNRWFRNHWKLPLITLAVDLLILILSQKVVLDNLPLKVISVILFSVLYIYVMYKLYKSGKDFYAKVKDLPEPINLEEIK